MSEEVLLIINTGTVEIDRIVLDKWEPLYMCGTSQVVPPPHNVNFLVKSEFVLFVFPF